jgi:hypothetical protein
LPASARRPVSNMTTDLERRTGYCSHYLEHHQARTSYVTSAKRSGGKEAVVRHASVKYLDSQLRTSAPQCAP